MDTPTHQSLRHYYLFWMGQQISSFGSSLVSFIIIWYITITTQSAIYLALSSALSFGTMMVVQIFSGYLTDYFNRKWILGVVDGLQALATTVLLVLFYLNLQSIGWILLLLAIRGVFDGLHAPAKGAIIPTMVPKDKLQRVNSLSSTARSIINLTSPPLAALLLMLQGNRMWVLLSIDAITFVMAIIPLFMISIPIVQPQDDNTTSLWQKMTGGMTFLKNSKGLLPLLFIFTAFNFFITPVSMLTPLIISSARGFAAGEDIFALALIVGNLGFLFVSLFLSRYDLPLTPTWGVICGFSVTIAGLLLLSYGIYTTQLLLFLIAQFVVSMGLPIVNVFSSIIWQSQVPGELQGRVISVRMMLVTFSLPAVMLATGILAESISFGLLFAVASVSFALMVLLTWILTDFRLIDKVDSQPKTSPIALAAD